jgi:integrase
VDLRPGELEALRWDRINFKAGKVRIDLNQVAKTEKGPKTAAGIREIDLSADALRALEAQKAISMMRGEHVWLNPRTAAPWETDAQIRKTLWAPLCKRAEVEYRNPYQIRHTYASARLTVGENPWYMAEQLGHVDVQMVFRVYGKFIRADYQKPKTATLRVVGRDS